MKKPDLAARQWILKRAAAGGINTPEVARRFRQSLGGAAKRLTRLREIGYLVEEDRSPHGRIRNVITPEGLDYLKTGESDRARRFDDGPLCAAMGYQPKGKQWQPQNAQPQ